MSNDTYRDGTDHDCGLYWSAKVYDAETNEFFKIKSDGEAIRVFPVDEDFSLSTFCRFYEFIVENVDRYAEAGTERMSDNKEQPD